MHPPRIAASALILGVLVSGCTPTSPPTSTVTVPTCTPEFGGDPYPCTQAEYERSQQTKARYAEAERVYREFNARSNDKGVRRPPEPSEEVLALTAGTLRQNWPEIHRAGHPLWWWTSTPREAASTHAGDGMAISIRARLVSVVFDMGDGTKVTCRSWQPYTSRVKPGTPSPTMGYTGTVPLVSTATRQVPVGELHALVRTHPTG